jgi:type IV pilus assembly protein PilV
MNMKRIPLASRQSGFSLLEVLVSVLVFSLGVLALVSLQAASMRLSNDARYRADAAFLADQLFARMLISLPADAAQFAHRTGGTACNSNGGAATNASALEWLAEVSDTLPGATAEMQQVVVDAGGQVTIRLCWQQGTDTPRQFVVSNRIQWQ